MAADSRPEGGIVVAESFEALHTCNVMQQFLVQYCHSAFTRRCYYSVNDITRFMQCEKLYLCFSSYPKSRITYVFIAYVTALM